MGWWASSRSPKTEKAAESGNNTFFRPFSREFFHSAAKPHGIYIK
jgi:hypothetical protein